MTSFVDSSVFDPDETVGVVQDAIVVSYNDDGAVAFARQKTDQLHDGAPAL